MTREKTPTQGLLDKIASLTNENEHTEARKLVANWISYNANSGMDLRRIAVRAYQVYDAIDIVHEALGHLPLELCELRSNTTHEMLHALAARNPDAAKAFNAAL